MAIIDGNKIGAADISGRDIGVLLKEKPFLYTYPDGISRLSYDAYQLCTSPLVNKYCKFRPGRKEGIRVELLSSSNPVDLLTRKIGFIPLKFPDGASLEEFAGYDHSCFAPVQVRTPQKLYKNLNNAFTLIGIESTSADPQFGFSELYGSVLERGWYGAVLLRNLTNGVDEVYIAKEVAPNAVDIDLTNDARFKAGDNIKALVCMSDTPYSEIAIIREFYSVWWEGDSNGAVTDYTLESYLKPQGWAGVVNVRAGTIMGDSFDHMGISIDINAIGLSGGRVAYKVVVSTDNNQNGTVLIKEGTDNITAGNSKTISISTGGLMPFMYSFNTVFVELYDTDSNRLINSVTIR